MNKDLFGNNVIVKNSLKDKFKIIPFSVLDSKTSDWKNRKNKWLKLGIKSELGRKEDLLNFNKIYSKGKKRLLDRKTSIFDPVICELMYDWFTKKSYNILDPFAGGSVRGIVAEYKKRFYTGIDIRKEQIESNRNQSLDILKLNNKPNYYVGDSKLILNNITKKFDFIFTCPPYVDLEIYSNLEGDLSNMNYKKFLQNYSEIINKSCNLLKNNRFACFMVGDVRWKDRKQNWYNNFVNDTINIFLKNNLKFYNEFIYLEGIGSSAMRVEQAFTKRKNIKLHQKILIFYKGNNVNDIRDEFNNLN